PRWFAQCVSTLNEWPPLSEVPVRSEFMNRLFAPQVLPYAGIQTGIGIVKVCGRHVTLELGRNSFNIANEAVLSANFVSGTRDRVSSFFMEFIPRKSMRLPLEKVSITRFQRL